MKLKMNACMIIWDLKVSFRNEIFQRNHAEVFRIILCYFKHICVFF